MWEKFERTTSVTFGKFQWSYTFLSNVVALGWGVYYLQNLFFFSFWCFPKMNDYSQTHFHTRKLQTLPPTPSVHLLSTYKWPQTNHGLTCHPLLGSGRRGGAAFRVPILRLVGCTCFPSPASYKSWAGGVVSRSTPIALSPLKALLPSHNLIYWLIICSANALPLVQDPALDHNAHQPWGVPFASLAP